MEGQHPLDRLWCRLFHKSYYVMRETMYGWQFVHCLRCKVTWPRRAT
jgi:hypothetical protein